MLPAEHPLLLGASRLQFGFWGESVQARHWFRALECPWELGRWSLSIFCFPCLKKGNSNIRADGRSVRSLLSTCQDSVLKTESSTSRETDSASKQFTHTSTARKPRNAVGSCGGRSV